MRRSIFSVSDPRGRLPDRGIFCAPEPHVITWTNVRQNVAMASGVGRTPEERYEHAMEYVKLVGLEDYADLSPVELSCGYGGGVGALKAMGAKMPEEEMQPLVDAWRAANPSIVAFWGALDRAARKVIRSKTSTHVGKLTLYWKDDKMLVRLP